MRFLLPLLTFVLLFNLVGFDLWSALAVSIWIGYLVNFLTQLNHRIAFREYILLMYGLNYLFSPALSFQLLNNISVYRMRGTAEDFFSVAIPAMFCLHAGLYLIKTKIFTVEFYTDAVQTVLNQRLLKQWLIAGFFISYSQRFLPGDLGFVAYLLGSIKYVAAFALFILDRYKYKWYLYGLLFLEVIGALAAGMFHDMVVWILFFGMVWTYIKKPPLVLKIGLLIAAAMVLFVLQSVKGSYRESLRAGSEGGFGSLSAAVSKGSGGKEGLFNMANAGNTLVRANQAWIFTSAKQRMDSKKNFQGMNLIKIYAEAAFLPRMLAPDKLTAGDNKIFNEYSGIRVLKGTSMGLGLFADGYISFGYFGTLLFAFVFGLLCASIFKLIERWTLLSPYFAFFCFPILNYAVRPDCETQTWMGHIVKGTLVFSLLVYFTRHYFQKRMRLQTETEAAVEASLQLQPNPA